MMNKIALVLFVMSTLMCAACQKSVDKEENEMMNLQQSISKLSGAASKIDADAESLWAYQTADSIVKTMELNDKTVWKDLARAYSALSYIGYGMSYKRTIFSGNVDNLRQLSETIVTCNPDTILPNKYLQIMELKSDASFIFFMRWQGWKRARK